MLVRARLLLSGIRRRTCTLSFRQTVLSFANIIPVLSPTSLSLSLLSLIPRTPHAQRDDTAIPSTQSPLSPFPSGFSHSAGLLDGGGVSSTPIRKTSSSHSSVHDLEDRKPKVRVRLSSSPPELAELELGLTGICRRYWRRIRFSKRMSLESDEEQQKRCYDGGNERGNKRGRYGIIGGTSLDGVNFDWLRLGLAPSLSASISPAPSLGGLGTQQHPPCNLASRAKVRIVDANPNGLPALSFSCDPGSPDPDLAALLSSHNVPPIASSSSDLPSPLPPTLTSPSPSPLAFRIVTRRAVEDGEARTGVGATSPSRRTSRSRRRSYLAMLSSPHTASVSASASTTKLSVRSTLHPRVIATALERWGSSLWWTGSGKGSRSPVLAEVHGLGNGNGITRSASTFPSTNNLGKSDVLFGLCCSSNTLSVSATAAESPSASPETTGSSALGGPRAATESGRGKRKGVPTTRSSVHHPSDSRTDRDRERDRARERQDGDRGNEVRVFPKRDCPRPRLSIPRLGLGRGINTRRYYEPSGLVLGQRKSSPPPNYLITRGKAARLVLHHHQHRDSALPPPTERARLLIFLSKCPNGEVSSNAFPLGVSSADISLSRTVLGHS
ncbi:hypothetical protein BD410DRAFT_845910 [Rickenella mellea]|uniref:Uncharacterized protein n=1 Tax=Rickenella mellea TaxID=50990 RepID=A0A4Y7PIA9_9AGAM|nr:hypothetical protein BD410DRAFT_845910 [Rickenella mellea]